MNPLLTLTSSFLLLIVYAEAAANWNSINENDMYRCYYTILCKLRKTDEFQAAIRAAGEKVTKQAMVWMREITKIPDAEDTPEFWEKYPGIKCAYPEETKKEMFNEWIRQGGEYWIQECEDPNSETCEKTEAAADALYEMFAKYTATGDCKPEGAEMAEGMADKMGAEAPKGMSPPSFG
ncbi:uncharacterized protein TNIN_305601 [Trichonephila inaurata madagascariensis]|uniref:Uncharacterized protein n=1 Tax=Trichonephila inaurata madagascariensis TaxID=2747483 RepID=A0A8X6X3N4_9ARAC|nr:uncharacterized protein TNIN_305601 [Trichonephila inaurata madagascariensis]